MSYQTVMQHFKTPAALAKALLPYGVSISPQAIYKWEQGGIPLDRAPLIEAATSGSIRADDLCPEVQWTRDGNGNLVGYQVRVAKPRAA